MSADTKIMVRVLKTHDEIVEIYALHLDDAKEQARRMDGVVTVLECWYPEDKPNEERAVNNELD